MENCFAAFVNLLNVFCICNILRVYLVMNQGPNINALE